MDYCFLQPNLLHLNFSHSSTKAPLKARDNIHTFTIKFLLSSKFTCSLNDHFCFSYRLLLERNMFDMCFLYVSYSLYRAFSLRQLVYIFNLLVPHYSGQLENVFTFSL